MLERESSTQTSVLTGCSEAFLKNSTWSHLAGNCVRRSENTRTDTHKDTHRHTPLRDLGAKVKPNILHVDVQDEAEKFPLKRLFDLFTRSLA